MPIHRSLVAAVAALSGLFAVGADRCSAQQRNLADLLNQAVPAVAPPAGQAAVPANRVGELSRLIGERDDITDGESMFSTLRDILREEKVFFREKIPPLNAAQVAFNAANRQLAIINGLAGGVGVDPGKAADARAAVDNAHRMLRDKQQEADSFSRFTLNPLYERIQGKLPRFFASYRDMGKQVPHDRSDPAHDELVRELKRGVEACELFAEGHVLLGVLHVYAGDTDRAMQHFTKARDIIGEHGLWDSMLGQDLCYGMLLLGRPKDVDEYVLLLKRKASNGGGAVAANWLIAKHAFAEGKYNEAIRYFSKAVAKAKDEAPPQLCGEASLLFVLIEDKVNFDKAEGLLETLDRHRDWRVLRARAGLAAGREEWDEAAKLIGECAAAAPLGMLDELGAQRAAYQAGNPWWVKKTGKPQAAVTRD